MEPIKSVTFKFKPNYADGGKFMAWPVVTFDNSRAPEECPPLSFADYQAISKEIARLLRVS